MNLKNLFERKKSAKSIAVVLIIAHKDSLTPDEVISLNQCYDVLGKHPIRLICPRGLDTTCYRDIQPEADIDFIPPHWQSTYAKFNRLKIDPFLYRRYSNYEYILFYELDAFVFRDELDLWCSLEFDYVGAPWFDGFAEATEHSKFLGVGNGGFSLRKVSSILRASRTFGWIRKPGDLWRSYRSCERHISIIQFLAFLRRLVFYNNTYHKLNGYSGNEDIYWCMVVAKKYSWFRVASLDEAIKFAFEANPVLLLNKNRDRLPFGCHAWSKLNRDFWKKYIPVQ